MFSAFSNIFANCRQAFLCIRPAGVERDWVGVPLQFDFV